MPRSSSPEASTDPSASPPDGTTGTAQATPATRRVSALTLGLLATPTAMSANAVTMVLPDIAEDVGTSMTTATWTATVFGLAVAVSTPLTAALLRHRGARITILTCAAFVILGTLTIALSESLPMLLSGRAAQAVGGSGFFTTAITLAGNSRRMAVVTAGSGMTGALGPLLGSLLADGSSWRASLSLSALALLAVPAAVRRAPGRQRSAELPRFDATGAVLVMALIGSLALISRFPLAALLGVVVLALALTAWVHHRPEGFLPSAVVRSPAFLAAAGLVCALSTSYFALLYTVPRVLEDNRGWASLGVGVGTLIALLVGSALSWGTVAWARGMSRSTLLTVLVGLGALAPLGAAVAPVPALLLTAAAIAVFAATAAQATLAVTAGGAVPEQQRTTAIGLFTLCYLLGGAFGPAIAGVLLS